MKDSIQAEETLGNLFNFQSTRCQLGSYGREFYCLANGTLRNYKLVNREVTGFLL